jgi:signal transduction histidine kinase
MTQAEISEKLHEFILSKLNSMPVSVLTNKEFQEFVFEINKEIFRLEQQIDLTEHATRIAEIEKKEIEQKFAATKEKFELAAEAAKVGVWEWSATTGQMIWCDQMYKLHRVENKEQLSDISKDFFELIFADDHAMLSEQLASIYHSNANYFNTQYRIYDRINGEIRHIEMLSLVKRGKKNEPLRMVGVCFDITEAKKAENEKAKLISNLINYNKDLEEFAFVVSHRLRSHTSKIQTAISVLNNASTEDLRKNVIDEIVKASKEMDETLRDLTRILSLKEEKKVFETVNLWELLNELQNSCEKEKQLENIQVHFDIHPETTVLGVRDYIKDIFMELCNNALKFKRNDTPLRIFVSSVVGKKQVEVIFKDNGMGIDLGKHAKKLFGLYRKFNANVEGKGIGLYMVKKQMELMGGKVSIQSAPQQGTQINLVFQKST